MRLVVVHTALLVLGLLVAYETWRHPDAAPIEGSVTLWQATEADVASITYDSGERQVVVDRRRDDTGPYLWVTITTQPGSGQSEAAGTEATEFPAGESGAELVRTVAEPRAVRDLGIVSGSRTQDYGFTERPTRLVVALQKQAHELTVGGTAFGTGDRYVQDAANGHVYVLPNLTFAELEDAETLLPERRLHRFVIDDVTRVTLRTAAGSRSLRKMSSSAAGTPAWAPADSPARADLAFGAFMDRVQQLWIDRYTPSVDKGSLREVFRVDYFGEHDNAIGRLEVLRAQKNDAPDYYLTSEFSHSLARLNPTIAEGLVQDIARLF